MTGVQTCALPISCTESTQKKYFSTKVKYFEKKFDRADLIGTFFSYFQYEYRSKSKIWDFTHIGKVQSNRILSIFQIRVVIQ